MRWRRYPSGWISKNTYDARFSARDRERQRTLRAIFLMLVAYRDLGTSLQALGTLLAMGRCCCQQQRRALLRRSASSSSGACLACPRRHRRRYAGLLVSYYADLPSGPAIMFAGVETYGQVCLDRGARRSRRVISFWEQAA